MGRGKTRKASASVYHCAMCPESFKTRAELKNHTADHPDIDNPTLYCNVCHWPFNDTHALELHKAQTGHDTSPAESPGMPVLCERCQTTYSQEQFSKHRSDLNSECADWRHRRLPPKLQQQPQPQSQSAPPYQGYVDLDKPTEQLNDVLGYGSPSEVSDAPSNTSDGGKYCRDCKRTFKSQAQFNNHMLGCIIVRAPSAAPKSHEENQPTASASGERYSLSVNCTVPSGLAALADSSRPMPPQTVTLNTRQPVYQQQVSTSKPTPALSRPQPVSAASSTGPVTDSATFLCNVRGCGKSYRSDLGLNNHKKDVHGIRGPKLDITGRDSWMLGQRERERLQAEGLLRSPAASSRGHGARKTPPRHVPPSQSRPHPPPPPVVRLPPRGPSAQHPPLSQHTSIHHQVPFAHAGPLPTSTNMGGAAEMDQAKYIQGKILRLLIQSDIFIHHDGKVTVCGIDWTRIGVAKQHEVVGMFDKMCHLPKMLQGEYLPPPKAFKDEYSAQYLSTDFESSPTRDLAKPGLGVIALSCNKVTLVDGRQEVVKIAAVDLVTCRILMNHLVCTDPHTEVKDWRSQITGLFSWRDMDGARLAGYKVFKGWAAARSTLWKFVDKETIIVGHNLRSDLDALRMIHGRAVDIAKVVEKAAKGPLSKAALGLDSLCRKYPEVRLTSDPEYGRDCLMNAFAARQFGLWVIKNQEKLDKAARQESIALQVLMPKTDVTVA